MAKRRKRRSSRKKKRDDYPGWVWLSFGLTIGLSVALAVYVKDRTPTNAAGRRSSLDDNGEFVVQQPAAEEPATTIVEDAPKKRFDFYDMLPAFEIIVPDTGPDINEDVEPKAIEEPGVYMLQAGSFSTHEDADR